MRCSKLWRAGRFLNPVRKRTETLQTQTHRGAWQQAVLDPQDRHRAVFREQIHVALLVGQAQEHEFVLGSEAEFPPAFGVVQPADPGPEIQPASHLKGIVVEPAALLPVEPCPQLLTQIQRGPRIEVQIQVGFVDVAVFIAEKIRAENAGENRRVVEVNRR